MVRAKADTEKVLWSGRIVFVQPRIRLMRSFDGRHYSYQGYVLGVEGTCGHKPGEFQIAVGKGAHERHQFRVGMGVSGLSVPVGDPRLETAGYCKTGRIKIEKSAEEARRDGMPFLEVRPDLSIYRECGHRSVNARTYTAKCMAWLWGCRMPVEMIIDQWNPSQKGYRFETFCYGPKSCPFYRAGATRKVPGRRGMTWEEEDWVDQEAASHREPDD